MTEQVKGTQVETNQPEEPQMTLQEAALENLLKNLQGAINHLCSAVVNIQTHDPRLTGAAKELKETVGDLTVTQAMLASRRKKVDG